MATGSSLSSYLEAQILNWIKGANIVAAPAQLYVALFTVDPTDASGSGTEVAGNGYARIAVLSSAWSAIVDNGIGNGSVISNSGVITFATPTGPGWGTVISFALYDALAAGNMIFQGELAADLVINAGDVVTFQIGALTITVD
jgi:hypothetical protein